MGALAKADADVKADPAAAMEAVSASMQGAMTPDALSAMWQDVDIGLKLDSDLAELLVAEADWVLSKGVVKGEAVTLDEMLGHFAPDALRRRARRGRPSLNHQPPPGPGGGDKSRLS